MKKVLLASASRVFLNRNKSLLSGRQFQLFTAMSGAESLHLHAMHHFDLVIADLKLEDMSGCTLCALVRKQEESPTFPVILICHNIPGSIERVEQSGASAILLKPVDPIKLLWTIGNLIGLQLGRKRRVKLNDKVASKQENLDFYCLSHDISNTGILLETDYQLYVGSRITCRFSLPNSCQIETAGKVIRSSCGSDCKNLYGVKFIDIPTPYRKAIDSYIASVVNSRTAA